MDNFFSTSSAILLPSRKDEVMHSHYLTNKTSMVLVVSLTFVSFSSCHKQIQALLWSRTSSTVAAQSIKLFEEANWKCCFLQLCLQWPKMIGNHDALNKPDTTYGQYHSCNRLEQSGFCGFRETFRTELKLNFTCCFSIETPCSGTLRKFSSIHQLVLEKNIKNVEEYFIKLIWNMEKIPFWFRNLRYICFTTH